MWLDSQLAILDSAQARWALQAVSFLSDAGRAGRGGPHLEMMAPGPTLIYPPQMHPDSRRREQEVSKRGESPLT